MTQDMDRIAGMMTGFFQSKALAAALELRLFDVLDQPATAEHACREAGIPIRSGRRLLIALHAMGLIRRVGATYHLTHSARSFLVSSSPDWMGWLARHCDTFLYPLWGKCADGVRDDRNQRQAVFGDGRSWFEMLYDNPADIADFQEFLGIMARPFIDGLLEAFDFTPYRRFLDIGSGSGALPVAVARRYPGLEIGMCELPEAAVFARDKMGAPELGGRIRVVVGDVIAGPLPEGRPEDRFDLMHLGWMLHDYAEETQETILRNILDSLPPGGTFVASETPLSDDESGPIFTALLSLNMLLSTDGGHESTVAQYLDRFRRVGFTDVHARDIPGPRTLLIGCKP